jgi:hypothetical protein
MGYRHLDSYFTLDQFFDTKYETAAAKMELANKVAYFIESGFPKKKFSKSVHDAMVRLYRTSLPEDTDDYDRKYFYQRWFSTLERQLEWLTKALAQGVEFGGPAEDLKSDGLARSDVKRALLQWMIQEKLVETRVKALLSVREQAERAQLKSLLAKYDPRGLSRAQVQAMGKRLTEEYGTADAIHLVLDDLVHEKKAEEASSLNNRGLYAQIEYLGLQVLSSFGVQSCWPISGGLHR